MESINLKNDSGELLIFFTEVHRYLSFVHLKDFLLELLADFLISFVLLSHGDLDGFSQPRLCLLQLDLLNPSHHYILLQVLKFPGKLLPL